MPSHVSGRSHLAVYWPIRVVGSGDGQTDDDPQSTVGSCLERDPTAVHLGDLRHDRQTEARAGALR